MPKKHHREEILREAESLAFDEGIGALTFGRVAQRLGIPDRTVVYYFPSKAALVGAVIDALGQRLEEVFEVTLDHRRTSPNELFDGVWKALARDELEPPARLYLQVIGLGTSERSPIHPAAKALVKRWSDWFAARLDVPPRRQQAEAEALLAKIDGLLILRLLSGPAAANRAHRAMSAQTSRT